MTTLNGSPIPGWVQTVSVAVFGLVFVTVVVQLARRDFRVTLDEQREMQVIAGSVVGIVTVTVVAQRVFLASVPVAVGAGLALGYGTVLGVQTSPATHRLHAAVPCRYTRRVMGWAAIAGAVAVCWVLTGIVESRLSLGFGFLFSVANLLVCYDLLAKHDDLDVALR